MTSFDTIRRAVRSERRLSDGEARWLLARAPLMPLGALAGEARRRRFPAARQVTFVVDANPNYTNVCDTYCSFCAFYRRPGDADAYTLGVEEMVEKARRAVARGATRLLLQGGHNPELGLDYYLDLIGGLRRAFPKLELHMSSPPEIRAIAGFTGLSLRDVLASFYQAGLRTLPGGGAEVLSDRVRRSISPLKGTPDDWLDVMRTAHQVGFRTTATLMYGHLESDADLVEHLRRLRDLQEETGGFFAFIPWSFKPGNNPLSRRVRRAAGPGRYLRVLAVARLYLDNFPHVQASWFSEGEKAGQLGLLFGADDFGGTLIEENVLKAADHDRSTTTERVVDVIRAAGFVPVQRNTTYDALHTFDGAAA